MSYTLVHSNVMYHITWTLLKNLTKSKLSFPVFISGLLTILPLLTSSALTAWAVDNEAALRSWPIYIWILVTVALTVSSSVALSPPTFIALVFGYFLGWIALPLLVGLNVGAIALIYGLSQFFNADKVRLYLVELYPAVRKMLTRFQDNEIKLIFFAKLSPVLPFAVTNLFFAMAGARLRQVILGGTLGMIPRTILAVWAGKEAQNIGYLLEHPSEGLFSKIVLIVLIVASTVGMGYFFRDKSMIEE